jgi:hypothetical protein
MRTLAVLLLFMLLGREPPRLTAFDFEMMDTG